MTELESSRVNCYAEKVEEYLRSFENQGVHFRE